VSPEPVLFDAVFYGLATTGAAAFGIGIGVVITNWLGGKKAMEPARKCENCGHEYAAGPRCPNCGTPCSS
jgi:hypothetical protein